MSTSSSSLQPDVASQRAVAVASFLQSVRPIAPGAHHATPAQLGQVAAALEKLAGQQHLFPAEHFPHAVDIPVYRLAEDAVGRNALYVAANRPGASQRPHDHTTWAVIAGVRGVERNVFYRREATDEPGRERLHELRTVDVVAGNSVTIGPRDVHTIEARGDTPSLHLHFYGLALDRLEERVVFDDRSGGGFRPFPAPARIRHALVSPAALKAALHDGAEIALLDVRETGVFARGHLLFAASAPLWRLELLIAKLVPRRDTRVVLADGDETIAHDAAAKLVRLGWRNVSVLAGGTEGWAQAGYEVFSGTNVPSKAFGELIEHEKHTPWIDADDLHRRVARGDKLVVVDSRTPEEFREFSLPFAHSLPGAELVYRIQELAPDPDTLVVVNCAGRTRSIVGAQTLIDAGIPNPVVSLKDGTMAWLLAGRQLAQGGDTSLPEPTPATLAQARERAAAVAERAGVRRIDLTELALLQEQENQHTLYRFDVRTRQEYEAGHLPGWRWAPGGQLVQASDEYAATRRARIVLADWDGVRALTTAAWLAQLGAHEVYVHTPRAHAELATGPEPQRLLSLHAPAPQLWPQQAWSLVRAGQATLFDVDRRAAYEKLHVTGARFAVPDRLVDLIEDLPPGHAVVLTSPDGVLARSVAAALAQRSGRDVRSLVGGTQAWLAAGLPTGGGADGVLTGEDDHWFSPYHRKDVTDRDAGFRDYLAWELGLVEQLQREGTTGMWLLREST
ncbi:rhodanese-like domain-containing protein [Ramlibacter sp.]|uniref:rhodanese-like domain-containing protein n=1 Tax=Ramlibacter sp. TaxID=1917967 RepID=UPI002637011A|nr:rhodanese-like domain-containing protein [Ramlibacter sp.]MDB5954848.1 Rhodanese-like protein [Ramlibacter sp.]